MPANLDTYRVATGERSNYAKFDGLVNTAQASLGAVGDQTQNQWGSGLILAPSQLSSGGASIGDLIPGDYHAAILADTPRGYWKLDEASGNFADSSGNSHTGTASGGITYSVAGAFNTGVTLDGTSGQITVADHADFDTGDVFTLEAWAKRTGPIPATMTLLDKGTGAYRLAIQTTGSIALAKPGTGTLVVSTTILPNDGAWHHIVATKNGATVKLYLDTVDVTGAVANQTITDTASSLGLGALGGLYLNGSLDEVAVYPTALSAARVAAHYAARGTLALPQVLIWNGTSWGPTSIRTRTNFTTTSTVDIVNDAAQKDLFTGNAATAATAGFALPPMAAGTTARIVARGDFLNNSGSGRKITLNLGLTTGGVFSPTWGDQSVNVGVSALRRAWFFRGKLMYRGTSSEYASGLFALSDTQAATTGLGAIRDPSNLALLAPFVSTDLAVDPNSRRLVLALTHEAANVNLSMRTLFARVEVTT